MAEDITANVSNALSTVTNVALKVELALHKLYKSVAESDDYRKLLASLKDPLKAIVTKVQGVLKMVLDKVSEIIAPLLKEEVVNVLKNVLEAGRDLVNSTIDLLPDSVQTLAAASQKFLNVIVDFVGAGASHLSAIIDLLLKIGLALAGETDLTKLVLLETTKKTVQETTSLLLPANPTLKAVAAG